MNAISNLLFKFANSFDIKDWDGLESTLMDHVECDYQDLRGKTDILTKIEYVNSRKKTLEHLKTQHLFSNLEIRSEEKYSYCRLSAIIYRQDKDGKKFDSHVMYNFELGQSPKNEMDHHGLVAAVCKDLKIAERIDARLGVETGRVVSAGQAVVAMILNGLGFTNRRLYLTHQFFETKPVGRLLDADIEAKDLTDYTLGHALDEIWSYGSSQLFGEVAFDVALDNGILGHLNHIDTTSLSVEGGFRFIKINYTNQMIIGKNK